MPDAKPENINLVDVQEIGRNDWYTFVVARVAGGERWIGAAMSAEPNAIFFFPEVASDSIMGLLDREEAIRMTAALAEDPVHGYGGVHSWKIPESLRAAPEEYECEHCGEVGCDGLRCLEDDAWWEDGDEG